MLASLPIEEPFDRLGEEAQLRAVVLLRGLLGEVPRMIVFTRGDAVEARPELFDYLLEIREEAGIGPLLRPVPSGPGRLSLRSQVLPGTSTPAGA